MSPHKESFNKFVLLIGARVLGILFSIAIPMYLGRKLSIDQYGTYKQLMLFFWFSQVALNLGVDDSAFYFFRHEPKKLPLFSFNALMFNFLLTGTLWVLLVAFKEKIAQVLGNAEMIKYLPILGWLIFVTVSSMQIEGILIVGLNRFKERLIVDMGTEISKSFIVLSAFFFFSSIKVALIFLCLLMTIRLFFTMFVIHWCKKKEAVKYWDSGKYFISQIKYGLPLGLSRILQNVLNMENFYISYFFSLAQFTFYSVGCFENPLVNAARMSAYELINIEFLDALKHSDHKRALEVWRSMGRKLFLFVIPFVTYMIFFAKEIITFIFSSKYLSSVPFFMVFNLYLIVGCLNPEPFFRATSKTQLALKIKCVGVIVGLLFLILGARFGGALYALSGKILGVFIMNVIGLFFGARLIKTSFLNLFQWKEIFKVSLLSVFLSCFFRLCFLKTTLNSFFILAISFSCYLGLHFYLSCVVQLIKKDEIEHLKSVSRPYFSKFKLLQKGLAFWGN